MLHYTGHLTDEQVRAMRQREGGGIWLLLAVIVGLVVWAEKAVGEVPDWKARVMAISSMKGGRDNLLVGNGLKVGRREGDLQTALPIETPASVPVWAGAAEFPPDNGGGGAKAEKE